VSKIAAQQLDIVASELEAAGTDTRQLSIKASGVTEGKLAFSWATVEILASEFSFSATRSTFTLTQAASSDGNVLDNAELLRNGVGNLDRVATTVITGDWSISGTTLSVHGDITSSGDGYTIRYVVGTASGAASASGNQIWLGTVPQEPLHAKSDYFQGTTLDPKWEEWEPLGEGTVTQANGEVRLTKDSTNFGYDGIIQDSPSDDQFCITARFSLSGLYGAQYFNVILLVGEDLSAGTGAPTTNGFLINNLHWDDIDVLWTAAVHENYVAGTGIESEVMPTGPVVYLRLFVDRTAGVAGEVTALISENGKDWIRYPAMDVNAYADVTSLTSMGIAFWNSTGAEGAVLCDVFRVDITTDPELPVGGFVGTSVPSTIPERVPLAVAANAILNEYGWTERKVKLIKVEAFCATVATVGAYTLALTKDPEGTADNMLSAATFDLTTSGTLSAFVPTNVPLTSTVDDLILDISDVWRAQLVSDNAGLDAAGVYLKLTWLVL
jgi:hypothetical protein